MTRQKKAVTKGIKLLFDAFIEVVIDGHTDEIFSILDRDLSRFEAD